MTIIMNPAGTISFLKEKKLCLIMNVEADTGTNWEVQDVHVNVLNGLCVFLLELITQTLLLPQNINRII